MPKTKRPDKIAHLKKVQWLKYRKYILVSLVVLLILSGIGVGVWTYYDYYSPDQYACEDLPENELMAFYPQVDQVANIDVWLNPPYAIGSERVDLRTQRILQQMKESGSKALSAPAIWVDNNYDSWSVRYFEGVIKGEAMLSWY